MPDASHMKDFWDARARENAEYFVDNRLDYRHGDEAFFWEQGTKDLATMLGAVGQDAIAEGLEILDVGCGVGRLSRALVARGARVTGIDISAEMVRRAEANVPEATFLVGDGTSLRPLPDAGFDAVVSLVVFQHIPDPRVTLGYVREIGRVLRPGGWAVFQVSNDPSIHSADYPKPRLRDRLLGRAPKGQDDPAWRGSAVDVADLRDVAAAAGLEIAAMSGEGTQYCIVRVTRTAA